MTPRVICLVGPDGAGKTTQARLLMEELSSRGIPCRYQWLRFRHVVSLPLLAMARLLGLSEVEELDSGRTVGYHYFWRSRFFSTLYPVLLFLDTVALYVTSVLWPLWRTDEVLVCDRYVFDTLVGLMVSTGRESIHQSPIGTLFVSLVPAGSVTLVLNADPETLRDRRDDVRHDRALDRKVRNYERIADDLGVTTIDADGTPEEIHEAIVHAIDER